MIIIKTDIPEVKLIKPSVLLDDRGFFQQMHHEKQYREMGIDVRFVQDNWSRSSQGVLRGLHYQLEHAQDKLISVIRGEVFDVAVDIRHRSPTFGNWVGAILSEENHHQLFIPKGFAHGFCVLRGEVDMVYKCSDFYTPGDEYALRWNDLDVGIQWPGENFLVAEKDQTAPLLKNIPPHHLPAY
jgi:dTDP-4-dehydrorhamnose 3,5-epimerase